jgi:hypothetical protein
MRIPFLKLSALCAAVLIAGCQTTPGGAGGSASDAPEAPSPANPQFAGEMVKFNAQFPNAKATKYEEESIAFNNEKKFDEKNGCHGKSRNPITIVLVLDANGKVTQTMTDVENAKAKCFRETYAGVQFPKPPMAPYRKAILLK